MSGSHFGSFQLRQVDGSTINTPSIIVFDVLQILGLVFISATLCTVWFSPGIRRSMGWFLFTFPWGLTCIGYLLIVRHQTGPSPDSILCLCSAMMIYSFPPLNALTFVVFALEIFLSIFQLPITKTKMMVLYFFPYGVFCGFLILVYILGRLHPTAVLRAPFGLFCYVSIGVLTYLSFSIVVCSVTASLILGAYITLKCHRHWSTCRTLLIHNGTPFCLVLRVGLVGAFSILTIVLAVINMSEWNKKSTLCIYIIWATFPAAVGIIFGSQEEILRAWMFWRKPPQPPVAFDPLALTSSGDPDIAFVKTELQNDECEPISQHSVGYNI